MCLCGQNLQDHIDNNLHPRNACKEFNWCVILEDGVTEVRCKCKHKASEHRLNPKTGLYECWKSRLPGELCLLIWLVCLMSESFIISIWINMIKLYFWPCNASSHMNFQENHRVLKDATVQILIQFGSVTAGNLTVRTKVSGSTSIRISKWKTTTATWVRLDRSYSSLVRTNEADG